MYLNTLVAYASLLLAVTATLLGLLQKPRWFWLAALSTYFYSYLAGSSTGRYTLSAAAVLLVVAVFGTAGRLNSLRNYALAVLVGIIIWGIGVTCLDLGQLFLPAQLVLQKVQ